MQQNGLKIIFGNIYWSGSENKREQQRWNYCHKYKPPYDNENVVLHIGELLQERHKSNPMH